MLRVMEVTGALSIKPSGNISLSTLTSVMTQPPSSPQPPIHEKDDLIPVSAGRHFLRRPNIPRPPLSLLCCCLHTTSCLSRVGQRSAQTAFRLCRHRSFHSYPTFVFFHQDHKKKKTSAIIRIWPILILIDTLIDATLHYLMQKITNMTWQDV